LKIKGDTGGWFSDDSRRLENRFIMAPSSRVDGLEQTPDGSTWMALLKLRRRVVHVVDQVLDQRVAQRFLQVVVRPGIKQTVGQSHATNEINNCRTWATTLRDGTGQAASS